MYPMEYTCTRNDTSETTVSITSEVFVRTILADRSVVPRVNHFRSKTTGPLFQPAESKQIDKTEVISKSTGAFRLTSQEYFSEVRRENTKDKRGSSNTSSVYNKRDESV
jgi:hypothetical protein